MYYFINVHEYVYIITYTINILNYIYNLIYIYTYVYMYCEQIPCTLICYLRTYVQIETWIHMCSHACRLCLSAALKFMSINTWGLNHRTGAVNITKQWMILKVTSSTANYHIQKFPGNFYVFKKTQHTAFRANAIFRCLLFPARCRRISHVHHPNWRCPQLQTAY